MLRIGNFYETGCAPEGTRPWRFKKNIAECQIGDSIGTICLLNDDGSPALQPEESPQLTGPICSGPNLSTVEMVDESSDGTACLLRLVPDDRDGSDGLLLAIFYSGAPNIGYAPHHEGCVVRFAASGTVDSLQAFAFRLEVNRAEGGLVAFVPEEASDETPVTYFSLNPSTGELLINTIPWGELSAHHKLRPMTN